MAKVKETDSTVMIASVATKEIRVVEAVLGVLRDSFTADEVRHFVSLHIDFRCFPTAKCLKTSALPMRIVVAPIIEELLLNSPFGLPALLNCLSHDLPAFLFLPYEH